ncbi:MAG: hypothetical protein R2709_05340 [Marmoricola sp.]
MSASVRVTRTIKRPVAEVAEVATDPEQLFAHFAGFARLMRVDDSDDDSLWDVFLDVGSYEVGSRVMLRRTSPNKLEWASVRGARNSMRLVVEPFADDPTKSRVVVTLRFELQGGCWLAWLPALAAASWRGTSWPVLRVCATSWSTATDGATPRLGVHLRRGAHRSDLIEQALAAGVGDRVGLPGVLDDLTRQAMRAQVPGTQVEWGFRWADDDYASKQWWPQGITTSADADPIERVHGQRLILTSWYAQGSDGKNAGSRISVIDLETLRYRHLLLVTPKHSPGGAVLEPLHVHAGGIVWFGGHLHVAGTKQGIFSARLDDIIKVRDPASMQGYRYVLPIESKLDSLLDEEGR